MKTEVEEHTRRADERRQRKADKQELIDKAADKLTAKLKARFTEQEAAKKA